MKKLKRIGNQTIAYETPPWIVSAGSAVGPREGQGPLGDCFDLVAKDAKFGQESFEQAEAALLREACRISLGKAGIGEKGVQAMMGGDLLNQIMPSSLAARALRVPFLGLYGACSTMSEGLAVGGMLCDGGFASPVLCTAASHYATAERQYRFPLEYGNQRSPASQWTVTGAGAVLMAQADDESFPAPYARLARACIGRVVDMGVSDNNNMGAAMAPAAAATLCAYFDDTGDDPASFDRIITGDLGKVGSSLLLAWCEKQGHPLPESVMMDCGLTVYDESQDSHAGGSGCGCSAVVLCSFILPKLLRGEWRRVLFMATGALLSPTTSQQGETIPGVAHAVVLEGVR
ncbi:MAG: stage V sporulation protein AD [Clostridia bacterium]|nr:stage V sporulation protein AD [Clostridia bacterium]